MPHILPCPVDRRQFSDSGEEIRPKKRRRRKEVTAEAEQEDVPKVAAEIAPLEDGLRNLTRERECPVPKPTGILGQVMGFGSKADTPREVIVKPMRERNAKIEES